MSSRIGWRRGARRVAAAVGLALALAVAAGAALAQQPPAPGAAPAVTTIPAAPAAPPASGSDTAPSPGTAPGAMTVIPRSTPEPAAPAARGEITLSLKARLTDEGASPPIDQGLVWYVFPRIPILDPRTAPKPKAIATSKDAAPTFKLPPGDYTVTVTYGRAFLSKKMSLRGTEPVNDVLTLNAGGLRVSAQLATGEAIAANAVVFDILSDDRDQLGSRIKVVSGGRPGAVLRLNSGIYQIVSTYGDANAVVRKDVTVEAGKLTEAKVVHAAARVTFKLVTRAGGEAIADTHWTIALLKGTEPGAVVKESIGALPTHTLAPGTYVALAKLGTETFRRDFMVKAGDVVQVEIVKS